MQTFKFLVYLFAALTSGACMLVLFRAYAKSGVRLLLWSALCFVCLTLNNVLLFFDLELFTQVDLRPYRLWAALAGVLFLLYGFIRETD
jgi:hypothetical protein